MYLAAMLTTASAALHAQSKSASKAMNTTTTITASTEVNKTTIRKLYTESLNKRDFDLLPSLIAAEYTGAGGSRGPQGFSEPLRALTRAFPDLQWNLQELLAEDDKVFVWWTVTGTHRDSFQGIAATGKRISSDGMAVYTLSHGRITTGRVFTDRMTFLTQLGVMPEDITVLRKPHTDRIQFIDTFIIPPTAREEFMTRVAINRGFIKGLPGFMEDHAYERRDEQGNIHYVTIATWESEAALKNAREAVQAEYKRQGFDPAAFMNRLQITMNRGVYTEKPE